MIKNNFLAANGRIIKRYVDEPLDLDYLDELEEKRFRERDHDYEHEILKQRQYEAARPQFYAGSWIDSLADWEIYTLPETSVAHYYIRDAESIGAFCSEPDMEKLRIALIAMPYDQFLKTHYWAVISNGIRRSTGRCVECGNLGYLQVHHKTYQHHGQEHKYLEDLQCLCKFCHEYKHAELGGSK